MGLYFICKFPLSSFLCQERDVESTAGNKEKESTTNNWLVHIHVCCIVYCKIVKEQTNGEKVLD